MKENYHDFMQQMVRDHEAAVKLLTTAAGDTTLHPDLRPLRDVAWSLADALRESDHTILGPTASSDEAIQLRTRCVPTLALVDITLDGRVEGLRDVWHVINLLVQQQDSEGLADCLGHGQQCVFIDGLDRELNGAGIRGPGIVTTDVRDIHISTPRA